MAETQPFVDELFLVTLESMGFSNNVCKDALVATGNISVDAALEHILNSNSNINTNTNSNINTNLNVVQNNSTFINSPPKQPISYFKNPLPEKLNTEKPPSTEKFNFINNNSSNNASSNNNKNKNKQKEPVSPILPSPAKKRNLTKDENIDDDDFMLDDEDENEDALLDNELVMDEEYAVESRSGRAGAGILATECLNADQVVQHTEKEIKRVAGVLNVSVTICNHLLRHMKWNSEKLIEKYLENPKKLLQDSGITENLNQFTNNTKAPYSALPMCLICGEEKPKKFSKLMCSHGACNACWQGFLKVKILECDIAGIHCMMPKCKCPVDREIISDVVDRNIFKKFNTFLAKSYVDENPNTRWCPSPGCSMAVRSDLASQTVVVCQCGFKFCFKCSEEAHAPVTCDTMKEWVKKCQDDSETYNWLKVNTQDCPSCHTAIEKNMGCNHMTCRKCKHEFCWICLGDWKKHTACNRYTEKETDKAKTRAALERYLHYYHRYNVHQQSKKLETKLREAAIQKMVALQEKDERWIDVKFIDEATEQLIECRRTLKHTYVFAYYLLPGPTKNLFEYLQEDLENATERLSGMLESTFDQKDRRTLVDITNLARRLLQNLLQGVEDGLIAK